MDAFLRRVAQQRDLEQEAAIIATAPEQIIRRCRLCTRVIKGDGLVHGASSPVRVCTLCGGGKMHAALLERDALLATRERYRNELLRCAGFQPVVLERQMSNETEAKHCPHCDKKLRADNTRGACSACLASGKGSPEGSNEAPPATTRKAKSDALKRFKVVAAALGVDPDKLINEFAEGWLERVRSSAKFGTDV